MTRRDEQIDDPRREFLRRALSAGVIAGAAGWNLGALAGPLSSVFGKLPQRMPAGRSIFEISGDVTINGARAEATSLLKPGDTVRTGKGALLIGVVNEDALILRENTELELAADKAAKKLFRLVTGAMLAVFGKRSGRFDVTTPVATIGVRGTGLYAESDPEKTYLCTCYGRTELSANGDPAAAETIVSQHHDAPRYILATPQNGKRIVPGGFRDHTDLELMTLEALVGREVPFKVSETGEYLGPRRAY